VGGAEGMLVSALLGMGAFEDVEVLGLEVAVEVGSFWVAIGAISRALWRARVLGFWVAVLELPRYLDAKLLAGLTSAVFLPPVFRV